MGRHPAADAALFLCVFGRWVGCAYLGDGSRCPALRGASSALPEEQERAERGRNRPRGGAGEGKLAEVWSEGWWRAAGRCAEGVASRRRGGGSWRRGVAGEHAARGHCLTRIEPLRGSTTSFSVTSGARPPALVPRRPSAPLASLRSFNRFRSYSRPGARPPAFRPRWPVSAPLIASAPVPASALVPRLPAPAGLSPLLSPPRRSFSGTFPFPLPARPCPRSRHDPFPLPAPVPAAFRPAPAAVSAQKKTPGPPKEGSGVEFRSAREAASPSMRWITSLRQVPGA